MDASMFATCTLQALEIDNCVGQKLGKTQALWLYATFHWTHDDY